MDKPVQFGCVRECDLGSIRTCLRAMTGGLPVCAHVCEFDKQHSQSVMLDEADS